VLRIKASDPSWPPLTLVDLPGLVQNGEMPEDEETVRAIVKEYMKEEKTIILAVVSAKNDPENQEILKMAKELDSTGDRTMGIIMKPDQVENHEAEDDWIRLAKNNTRHKCGLGWHIVRNRGPNETQISFAERDGKESQFFKTSSWGRSIDSNQLGIDTLRERLSLILEEKARKTLPDILDELTVKSKQCDEEIKSLGPLRNDHREQQRYLTEIGFKFQNLVEKATIGYYDGNFFDGGDGKPPAYEDKDKSLDEEGKNNLRAKLLQQHDKFRYWMVGWGHSYEPENAINDERKGYNAAIEIPEMSELLDLPKAMSSDGMLSMIETILQITGVDYPTGTFNPAVVTKIFRLQSSRWESIARAHIKNIWKLTSNFLERVAKAASINEHTAKTLMDNFISPKMEQKLHELNAKLDEIVRPYQKFATVTYDPLFQNRRNEYLATNHREMIQNLKNHIEQSMGVKGNVKQYLESFQWVIPPYASKPFEILAIEDAYYQVFSDAMATCFN
jgi:Dynamin central region/Dynamin family